MGLRERHQLAYSVPAAPLQLGKGYGVAAGRELLVGGATVLTRAVRGAAFEEHEQIHVDLLYLTAPCQVERAARQLVKAGVCGKRHPLWLLICSLTSARASGRASGSGRSTKATHLTVGASARGKLADRLSDSLAEHEKRFITAAIGV